MDNMDTSTETIEPYRFQNCTDRHDEKERGVGHSDMAGCRTGLRAMMGGISQGLVFAETPPPPLACGERSPSPAKAREEFDLAAYSFLPR
ncbi:hypothetical protein ACLBWH_03120, partial [Sphingomonas sp. M6A6_1c]